MRVFNHSVSTTPTVELNILKVGNTRRAGRGPFGGGRAPREREGEGNRGCTKHQGGSKEPWASPQGTRKLTGCLLGLEAQWQLEIRKGTSGSPSSETPVIIIKKQKRNTKIMHKKKQN